MKKLIVFIFILLPVVANAADHYASPTGTDTWANSTNISTPCSLSTAFSNASAGDTVYLRGGSYSLSGQTEVSNNGSSGNEIVFRNYTGETATITLTTTPSTEEGQIQILGDYWQFIAENPGEVVIHYRGTGIRFGDFGHDGRYGTVDGLKFIADIGTTDNSGAMKMSARSHPFLIKNVEIDGPISTGTYDGNNSCLFIEQGDGIFQK